MTRSNGEKGAWSGIRAGLPAIFDRHLSLDSIGRRSPHFQNREALLKLSRSWPTRTSINGMLKEALRAVQDNVGKGVRNAHSRGKKCGSVKNWRWVPQKTIRDDNRDPEVILERAVARACWPGWVNQIPVASGVMSSSSDHRTAIDLACRRKDDGIDLIELKWESDTPLYAALEIVGYGLVLLAYRKFVETLLHAGDSWFLDAKRIGLRVLAPFAFYDGYSLGCLEDGINSALRHVARCDLEMDFAFRRFPAGFCEVPFTLGKNVNDETEFRRHEPLLRRAFEKSDPDWATC